MGSKPRILASRPKAVLAHWEARRDFLAVLNINDVGQIATAAAMGMMIFYTKVSARLVHAFARAACSAAARRWAREGDARA